MIRQFLDLSTAHLSLQTRAFLDAQGEVTAVCRSTIDPDPAHLVGSTPHGWFVWAGFDSGDYSNLPADLQSVMQRARQIGCDYILFDARADEEEGLPVYDENSDSETLANVARASKTRAQNAADFRS